MLKEDENAEQWRDIEGYINSFDPEIEKGQELYIVCCHDLFMSACDSLNEAFDVVAKFERYRYGREYNHDLWNFDLGWQDDICNYKIFRGGYEYSIKQVGINSCRWVDKWKALSKKESK